MITATNKDYRQEYEEFWKDIVEDENGNLDKEQIMKELSDFSMVIDNCTQAYYLLSKNKISDPTTMFYEVENIFNEEYSDDEIIIEDMKEMLKETDINVLKKNIVDYFGILQDNEVI